MIDLDTVAEFVWGFGRDFLLTVHGEDGPTHYVWSDPSYGGDNTIKPYSGDPRNFAYVGFAGRCKGTHRIGNYCGDKVKFQEKGRGAEKHG